MGTDLKPILPDIDAVERTLIQGDLAKLNAEQRIVYYRNLCESLGLNSMTRPFEYITLGGRLVLYCRKDGTDQLRKLYNVSVIITNRSTENDVHTVCARATLPDGRTDESTGSINLGGLRGDSLANALMKAETKAKRRVTLSICGLGFLDESELGGIPNTHTQSNGPRPLQSSVTDFHQTDLLATPADKVNSFLRGEPKKEIAYMELSPQEVAEHLNADVVPDISELAKYEVLAGRFKGMVLGNIPKSELGAYLPIVKSAPNEKSRELGIKIEQFLSLQKG